MILALIRFALSSYPSTHIQRHIPECLLVLSHMLAWVVQVDIILHHVPAALLRSIHFLIIFAWSACRFHVVFNNDIWIPPARMKPSVSAFPLGSLFWMCSSGFRLTRRGNFFYHQCRSIEFLQRNLDPSEVEAWICSLLLKQSKSLSIEKTELNLKLRFFYFPT